MNQLEKQYVMKKEALNETNYFQSILQEAYRLNLLTAAELESIQFQIIQLLAKQTEHYTGGESSSVKVETAQGILQSIYYCIGIYLKSFQDIELSFDALKQNTFLDQFQHGKKLIVHQYGIAQQLLASIQKECIITDNIAYNDTIQRGLSIFFSTYDIDYAAHDTPCSIDYPLCNDKMNLVGIEYIYTYLEKLDSENNFCNNFSDYDINQLLSGYSDDYQDLLINIFELVLTNAIGSVLSKKSSFELNLEQIDRQYLYQKLISLSKDELDVLLQEATTQLCLDLAISDAFLRNHITSTMKNISVRLKNALETNQLEKLFISFKTPDAQAQFQFEDGKKLDDKLFKKITEEIRDCRYASDKIAIIRKEIHSIIDLIDVLEGDCIFDKEYDELFQSFSEVELALLLNKLQANNQDFDYHLAEDEKEWHGKLNNYLKELNPEKAERVNEIAIKC